MSLLSTLRQIVERNQNNCDETELDPATVYEMLNNRRRRCILQYLAFQDDRPVAVSDLADDLSRHHNEDRTAIYVAAIQSHLPKMSQAGVCSYDQNRKLIELTPRGRSVIEVHQAVMELLD